MNADVGTDEIKDRCISSLKLSSEFSNLNNLDSKISQTK